jgi:hypothetical protein
MASRNIRSDMARFSDELESWLKGEGDKSLGGLLDLFGERGFAILFVILLGPSALPIPTGGATHVFEAVAVLVALQLLVGRDQVWLPRRWRGVDVAGPKRERFLNGLLKLMRRLEGISRPRLRFLFGHRLSSIGFGALVITGTAGAILAPPFSGLDTLPSLGVVLLSLGVLLEDGLVAAAGIAVGAVGILLEFLLGQAAVDAISDLV